jgi:uncharacterized membrane protein
MFCCLIYDLFLQKRAAYMLPSLVFQLIGIICVILIIVFFCIMLVFGEVHALILITILAIVTGKDRDRLL